MVNGFADSCFCTLDFGFQRRDASMQFINRERIKILPRDHLHRIRGPSRKKFIRVHAAKVDPLRRLVNNNALSA